MERTTKHMTVEAEPDVYDWSFMGEFGHENQDVGPKPKRQGSEKVKALIDKAAQSRKKGDQLKALQYMEKSLEARCDSGLDWANAKENPNKKA